MRGDGRVRWVSARLKDDGRWISEYSDRPLFYQLDVVAVLEASFCMKPSPSQPPPRPPNSSPKPLHPPILLFHPTPTMFPYPFDEALILVLLLFISAFISDSDIPKKVRVVLNSGVILAMVPRFLWQAQYHNVVLYNDVQACREESTRHRYTTEQRGSSWEIV